MTVTRDGVDLEKKSVTSLSTWRKHHEFADAVSTHDTGEAYLQDIVKLFYNHPLLISQFELLQDRFMPLCELVNCLSMFQGIIQHVKGRVPMGCNIPWQVGDTHTELFQDVTPGWKHDSGRVDDLIAKFMELSKLSDLPV